MGINVNELHVINTGSRHYTDLYVYFFCVAYLSGLGC